MEGEKLTKREKRALAKEEKRKIRERSERTKKIRNWFIGLLVIIGLFFGGYRFLQWINTPQPEATQTEIEVIGDEWIKGNPEASITLVEYSDFQCPACKNYAPLVKRLSEELPDDLRIVYRQYPLTSIHKNAFASAKASEAAGKQGKFWEMHDLLFENQDSWSADSSPEDKFEGYASEIGLEIEQFKADYDSDEAKDAVNEDIATANRLGLSSTPSFTLNDRKIESPKSYDAFKGLIEDEIRDYSIQ